MWRSAPRMTQNMRRDHLSIHNDRRGTQKVHQAPAMAWRCLLAQPSHSRRVLCAHAEAH